MLECAGLHFTARFKKKKKIFGKYNQWIGSH